MNAVWRERFTPAMAAEAVNPIYICMCDSCALAPHVPHKNAHGRVVHLIIYDSMSLPIRRSHGVPLHVLRARRPQVDHLEEVGGHLRRR